jgi:hypothetical protein
VPEGGLTTPLDDKYALWNPWIPHLNAWAKSQCPKGTYVECCDSLDQRTFGGTGGKYPTLAKSTKTGIEVCSCPTPASDNDVTNYNECLQTYCGGFEPLNNYQACKIAGSTATTLKDFSSIYTVFRADCKPKCTTTTLTPTSSPSLTPPAASATPVAVAPKTSSNSNSNTTGLVVFLIITFLLLIGGGGAIFLLLKQKK